MFDYIQIQDEFLNISFYISLILKSIISVKIRLCSFMLKMLKPNHLNEIESLIDDFAQIIQKRKLDLENTNERPSIFKKKSKISIEVLNIQPKPEMKEKKRSFELLNQSSIKELEKIESKKQENSPYNDENNQKKENLSVEDLNSSNTEKNENVSSASKILKDEENAKKKKGMKIVFNQKDQKNLKKKGFVGIVEKKILKPKKKEEEEKEKEEKKMDISPCKPEKTQEKSLKELGIYETIGNIN